MPKLNGKAEKAPLQPLPPGLKAALPSAAQIAAAAEMIRKAVPAIRAELDRCKRSGATQMARAYVVFHRIMAKLEDDAKPLDALYREYKDLLVPETFEDEGVTSIPLSEGFRVGTSLTFRASIREGMKDHAYQWLRENQHADIISSTVNSSTLAATASELLKDHCKELPSDLFNVAVMPNTSVTATK